MIKTRNLAALLALSSVVVLPACSMFGGGSQSSRAGSTRSYAAAPNYNSTSQPQNTELTPDMIRNVQQTLQQDGSYHGRVDGVWGPSTQASVRSYQQQHNLNATGQLDQDTLASMKLAAGQNNDTQPSNQRYGSNYNPPPPNASSNPQPDNTNQPTTNTTR